MLKPSPSPISSIFYFRRHFSKEPRFNPLNIQILGQSLSEKVFPSSQEGGGGSSSSSSSFSFSSLNRIQMQALELSRRHLESHSIPWEADRSSQIMAEISGQSVPQLLATNLRDHFAKMAADLAGEHFKLAVELAEGLKTSPAALFLPSTENFAEFPQQDWDGWIGWDHQKRIWIKQPDLQAEGPRDSVIVFDVETCPQISKFPFFASAYGPKTGWSFWLRSKESLIADKDSSDDNCNDDSFKLIPLKHPTLVIGHHVSYDRARIRDEYSLTRGPKRFLDTLSMHCAVAGLSSQQRGLWQERKKKQKVKDNFEEGLHDEDNNNEDDSNEDNDHYNNNDNHNINVITEKWGSKCSLNNLADALQLHCNRKLDKSVRDEILLKSTDWTEIFSILPKIAEYCAKDVEATAHLFSALLPKFLHKSPSPVTFTALLEMNTFILPLKKDKWTEYLDECDAMLSEASNEIEGELKRAVEDLCRYGLNNIADCKNDPWLGQLDWTVEPVRFTKARYLKDGVTFAKGGEPRPIGNSLWSGKPAWYKKLVKNGQIHVTPRTAIVPLLLKLCWKGKVVHLIPEKGWCYVIESENDDKGQSEGDKYGGYNTLNNKSEVIRFNGKKFHRIPHPGGRDENVGCLLTKNFLKCFQSGDLITSSEAPKGLKDEIKSTDGIVKKVLEINSKFSFWTGYRERVREQFVVSTNLSNTENSTLLTNPNSLTNPTSSTNSTLDLILPTVQPMGTVTRRAVEKTWMTASNAKESLVGSELKAMICAPAGWCFVGADVDSQELWIGSLLGDAQFGWSGSTALGWMTLQGSKAEGTDLHSRTAKILGMTRDNAKIFNYGRIYGAGVKYAAQLLLKFNPKMPSEEAATRAAQLYYATKGKRVSNRRDAFVSYAGGTESFMFNQMEAIARAPVSRTPVLAAEISDALASAHVDDNFITSRVNWVVQSSGVDYLHMLLVAVAFLFKHFKIPGRVAITIHDEIRFLVPETEKLRAALALQIANLWTRAAFVQAVGVQDLPLSVAFFSAVDIDSVLRKEVHLPCLTPSNKSSIPPGQALDIYKLLKNCPSLNENGTDSIKLPISSSSSASASNFMYKYYREKMPLEVDKPRFMNLNDEQKYLAVLRKQMQKPPTDKSVTDTSVVDKSNNSENSAVRSVLVAESSVVDKSAAVESVCIDKSSDKVGHTKSPGNPSKSKGEIFDRWNDLIKKQKSNNP